MSGYYELKINAEGKASFNLKAGNHQVILTSQNYQSKESALNGIASVRSNGGSDASFERKESSNGKPYFVLKAGNGQIIGNSELYESEAARDKGIASVIENASTDKIVEILA